VLVNDAHRAPRRCAVVQAREDYVTVLGRTTQVQGYDEKSCLLSPAEPLCRLDRAGMYTTRHKHSIARPHFNDERKCEYYGTLATESSEQLLGYWERQLGLR
jgi:hypothetical protein